MTPNKMKLTLTKTPMSQNPNSKSSIHSNQSKRRTRYKRDADDPRRGKFQSRGDNEIILLVHEYKYLTRTLLELLTGRKGTSLKNRLRFLYDNGYLLKVQFSRSYTETGSTPDIYILDEQGREVYQKITGQKADPSTKRNQNKDPQLEHALLVNSVRAIMTNACANNTRAELQYWLRSGKDARDVVKVDGRQQTIAPDAFFVLKKPDGKASPFFLEADRSTMDQPTFTAKLRAYYAYWRAIRDELDGQKGSPKKRVSNRFNIQGFRVLTIIEHDRDWQRYRNKDRLSHLIEAGIKATGGKGFKGFWYTSKAHLDPNDPASIFKPIWQIAHPSEKGKLHSLLE